MLASPREVGAIAALLSRYWLAIRPGARRELAYWRRRSAGIPDPFLRNLAQANLGEEDLVPESVAIYAVLGSRRHRKNVTRLLTTFQVMYNYLDSVAEQPVAAPHRNSLALYGALRAALDVAPATTGFYRYCPHSDDGGFLDELIGRCRDCFRRLPSREAVLPTLRDALTHCIEGQSHTHAAMYEGPDRLREWSLRQAGADVYTWWEIAAAGVGASMSVVALLGAAGDPKTTASDAVAIGAAYFPAICALATLMDSLIDRSEDGGSVSHSSVGYYETSQVAAQRMGVIARRAREGARELRGGRTHAAITLGVGAFALASPETDTAYAAPIMDRVMSNLGPRSSPIVATLRLQRHLRGRLSRNRPATRPGGSDEH